MQRRGSTTVSDVRKRLVRRRVTPVVVPSAGDDAIAHGVALVAAPACFALLGLWIDHLLGTGWIVAAALAAFGVTGSVASLYYRYEARIARLDEGKPWTRRAS